MMRRICETEKFIRDCAARGWSRNATREALDISRNRWARILEAIPGLEWVGAGRTMLAVQAHEARRGVFTDKQARALAKAHAVRSAKCMLEGDGLKGTPDQLAKHSPVSAHTIRRRVAQGMSLRDAVRLPPKPYSERRKPNKQPRAQQ